jgi:hypothetical protein
MSLGSMTPESFRQQYPQGGLVSELAAIEHGQYVVRVLVKNEGRTLTSGLAAAASVEQAEDLARARALALLGSPGTFSSPVPVKPVVPQAIATVPAPVPMVAPKVPPLPTPKPQVKAPEPVAAKVNQGKGQADFKFDLPLSEPPEEEPIIEESFVEEPELPLMATVTSTPTDPEEALDFSDIIARSDVELKRLGWTSEQGRNYLLETYGKRSRQLLSDDELLEFLRFLEAQPMP